jgi:hypothetical protein
LEDIIRQTFKLPVSLELVITYTDMENDVVTMGGDQDLQPLPTTYLLLLHLLAVLVTTPTPTTTTTMEDHHIIMVVVHMVRRGAIMVGTMVVLRTHQI